MEDITLTCTAQIQTLTPNVNMVQVPCKYFIFQIFLIFFELKLTLSSKPVIFAWYSGKGLDLPSYCPATVKEKISLSVSKTEYY